MSDAVIKRGRGRPKKVVDTGKIVECVKVGMSDGETAREAGISVTQYTRMKKRDATLREAVRIGKTGSKFDILSALRDEAVNRRTIGAIRELMRRLEMVD
jgi:hypothetical protein